MLTGLPCCAKSTDDTCRAKCEQALRSLTNEEDIIDEIVVHCGAPNPAVSDASLPCFNP